MFKKDLMWVGIIIGALSPLLVSVLINFVNIKIIGNTQFDIMNSKPALMGSLVLNVLLFRVAMMNLKKYAIGKGLLLATIVYAFLIIIR